MTPPERLRRFLAEHRIEAEIVAPGPPMPTVAAAAAALGVSPAQIIKTLLFEDRQGAFAVAIAAGPAKIDRSLLAVAASLDRPRLAAPETALRLLGYPAGGVPPLGHATPLPVVVDQAAATLDTVYGGGGAEDLLLRIAMRHILRTTNATIAPITHPATASPSPAAAGEGVGG